MQEKISARLADTLTARFPHPDNYPFCSWSYSQGFMLMGFIHLYESTGEAKYRDYALRYADFHVSPEGHIYRFAGDSMDSMMAGAVITWAWKETGEARYRAACDEILAAFSDYPRVSNGGFWHAKGLKGEMWVDGVFMGGMFLSHYGVNVGRAGECFAEIVRQLDAIHELCEKQGGLLYHAWSERPRTPWANRLTGKSTDVWSEGLGWYVMMLAEASRLMPADQPGRERIRGRLVEVLNTLAGMRSENGLFYQVVDKGSDPDNWTDTSGSAMFLYSFVQAVRMGLGDAALYNRVIEEGYEGLRGECVVNDRGLVDVYDACDGLGVQNNYDAYLTFPKAINAKEAVAAVLWATEAIENPR